MKQLLTGILCLTAIAFSCLNVSAQSVQRANFPKEPDNAKPRLFRNVPDRMSIAVSKLMPVVRMEKGQAAALNISDKFVFRGKVISSVSKYNNTLKTIVIKSAEFEGANLSLSEIKLPDGTTTYRGRIISFQHGDCFELKYENGEFVFIKKKLNDMLTD